MARLQCSRQSARKKKEHLRIRRSCGFSQSRAWNLLNGPMEQWNSETLINVLARFGFTLELVVKEHRRSKVWCSYAQYEETGAELYPARLRPRAGSGERLRPL